MFEERSTREKPQHEFIARIDVLSEDDIFLAFDFTLFVNREPVNLWVKLNDMTYLSAKRSGSLSRASKL